MIVVDASTLVQFVGPGTLDDETTDVLAQEDLHAPDILTVETASGLRGLHLGGMLNSDRLDAALEALLEAPIRLHGSAALLRTARSFWSNVSAYDAMYAALAHELRCPLMTMDVRLARAVAEHVEVVVPQSPEVA